MFNFENTPITGYTKLLANYKCAAPSLLTYDGDWARITLQDGTVLEVESQAQLNSLLPATSTATVAGETINVNQITKIEFGTKVTTIPAEALPIGAWTSLNEFNGFHDGLTSIGASFYNGIGGVANVVTGTFLFPSSLTSIGSSFMWEIDDFRANFIMNANPALIAQTNYVLAVADSTEPSYVNGIQVKGEYANDFITRFPNRNTTPYRNLYNGNTLESFFEALEDGTAQETMPPGTLIPDLYNGSTAFNWRVLHYGPATSSGGEALSGIYLQALVNVGHAGASVADYGASSLNVGLNALVNNFSESIQSKIVELNVPYYYNGANKQAVAKLWLPSTTEIYGVYSNATGQEGFPFDYFKNASGWTAPSNNATSVRVQPPSGAISWGTRSWASGNNMNYVSTTGAISTVSYSATTKYCLPCVFIPAKIKVDVSFNANGGTPEPPTQKVFTGDYATKPEPDPSKADSEFVGWFLPGQTYDFVGEIPVMFRMNGGTPQVPTQYVKAGEYAEDPTEVPERDGYEFLGWYKAGEIPDDWDGVNVV